MDSKVAMLPGEVEQISPEHRLAMVPGHKFHDGEVEQDGNDKVKPEAGPSRVVIDMDGSMQYALSPNEDGTNASVEEDRKETDPGSVLAPANQVDGEVINPKNNVTNIPLANLDGS